MNYIDLPRLGRCSAMSVGFVKLCLTLFYTLGLLYCVIGYITQIPLLHQHRLERVAVALHMDLVICKDSNDCLGV